MPAVSFNSHPVFSAESEQLCIRVHFVNGQHAAHVKEKRVAGVANGAVHIHLAVHAEAARFVIWRIIVVRAVAVHGVRGRRDDAFLQRRQGDKGLKTEPGVKMPFNARLKSGWLSSA